MGIQAKKPPDEKNVSDSSFLIFWGTSNSKRLYTVSTPSNP